MRVRLPPGFHVQFGDVGSVGESGLAQRERHHHMMSEHPCETDAARMSLKTCGLQRGASACQTEGREDRS